MVACKTQVSHCGSPKMLSVWHRVELLFFKEELKYLIPSPKRNTQQICKYFLQTPNKHLTVDQPVFFLTSGNTERSYTQCYYWQLLFLSSSSAGSFALCNSSEVSPWDWSRPLKTQKWDCDGKGASGRLQARCFDWSHYIQAHLQSLKQSRGKEQQVSSSPVIITVFGRHAFNLLVLRCCCVSPGTPQSWITLNTTVPLLPNPTFKVRWCTQTHTHTDIHHHVNSQECHFKPDDPKLRVCTQIVTHNGSN